MQLCSVLQQRASSTHLSWTLPVLLLHDAIQLILKLVNHEIFHFSCDHVRPNQWRTTSNVKKTNSSCSDVMYSSRHYHLCTWIMNIGTVSEMLLETVASEWVSIFLKKKSTALERHDFALNVRSMTRPKHDAATVSIHIMKLNEDLNYRYWSIRFYLSVPMPKALHSSFCVLMFIPVRTFVNVSLMIRWGGL